MTHEHDDTTRQFTVEAVDKETRVIRTRHACAVCLVDMVIEELDGPPLYVLRIVRR